VADDAAPPQTGIEAAAGDRRSQRSAEPEEVLADVRVLMKPARVLILMAIGTMPLEEVERLGFHTFSRPFVIEQIVHLAGRLIRSADEQETRRISGAQP
jgi:hypothetical protein